MHTRRLLLFAGLIISLSMQWLMGESLCRLDFDGNHQIPASLLRAELTRFGDALTTLAPAFFAEHLHTFYKNYGFLEAKIEAARHENNLKITIAEGPALVIDQVAVVSCDPSCMHDEVQKSAREILNGYSTKKPLEFKCIEKVCRQIEALCARDGYSDVRVKNWHVRPHGLFSMHDPLKKCVLELDVYLGARRFVSSVRAESSSGEQFKNAFVGSSWEHLPVPFDLYMIREQRLWLLRFFGENGGNGGDGGDGGEVELSPSWTFVDNRADIVWTCTVSEHSPVAESEVPLKKTEAIKEKRLNDLFVRGGLQVGGRGYAMQLFPFVSGSFCSRAAGTKASLDVLLSESFCTGSAQYQFAANDDWLSGLSVEGISWSPCAYGAGLWCGRSRLSKSGFYGRTVWNGRWSGSVSDLWRVGFGGGFELLSPPHVLPRLVFSPSLAYRSGKPKRMGKSSLAAEGVLVGIVPLSGYHNKWHTPALLKVGVQGEYGRLLGEHVYGEVRGRLGVIGGGACADVHPFDRLFMRRGALLSGFQSSFGEQIGSFGFCPYTGSCGGTGLCHGLVQLSTPLSRSMELACFVEGGRLWRSGTEGQGDEKAAVIGIGLHIKTPVGKLCADCGWDLCSPAHPRDALFWFFGWDAHFS